VPQAQTGRQLQSPRLASRKLQRTDSGARRPQHAKPGNRAVQLHNLQAPGSDCDEHDVDWEAHPEGVDRSAVRNQKAGPARQASEPREAQEPLRGPLGEEDRELSAVG
jgi:hypothetical protein